MNKNNNDKGQAATADSTRNSELNGALGAIEYAAYTIYVIGTTLQNMPPLRWLVLSEEERKNLIDKTQAGMAEWVLEELAAKTAREQTAAGFGL